MKTLFPSDFNWTAYFTVLIGVNLVFMSSSLWIILALAISVHQVILLFTNLGKVIPVRYLFGCMICLQYLIGPSIQYNFVWIDELLYFKYKMQVTEDVYFAYVIPAVLAFIIGLHIAAKNFSGERIAMQKINEFVRQNPMFPYYLIGIGFLVSLTASSLPEEIAFVLYIIANFKFIGLFMLLLGEKKLKLVPMILVIGSVISSSLGAGMFHDLLIWLMFTGAIFAIKFKFNAVTKLLLVITFIILTVILQQLKFAFRSKLNSGEESGNIGTLTEVYDEENSKGGIFDVNHLAKSVTRINQGFLLTNVMFVVPDQEPFADGSELLLILKSAILPRVLAPDKLTGGNKDLIYKYAHVRLRQGTSMAIGALGDFYLNYGAFIGCLLMFGLGFLFSYVLNIFQKQSFKYPIIILFTPIVFYYPIRPDCETHVVLGHLIKATFIVFAFLFFFKSKMRVRNI